MGTSDYRFLLRVFRISLHIAARISECEAVRRISEALLLLRDAARIFVSVGRDTLPCLLAGNERTPYAGTY